MYTFPNPFTYPNFGFNSNTFNPVNCTPNFPVQSWNTPWNWNTNQYGWTMPFNGYGANWGQPVNCTNGVCPSGYAAPFNWNWSNPVGSFGWNTFNPWNSWNNVIPQSWNPSFPQYTQFNGQPWQFNAQPWNQYSFNQPFGYGQPFPGLYNFNSSASFGGYPFPGNSNSFGSMPSPFGFNAPNFFQGYSPSFGFNPFMNPMGFGWNTPIFWGGMPKNDVEMPGVKKGEMNVPQNRMGYPIGFGPFVPFAYPNAEFVKNGVAACAA